VARLAASAGSRIPGNEDRGRPPQRLVQPGHAPRAPERLSANRTMLAPGDRQFAKLVQTALDAGPGVDDWWSPRTGAGRSETSGRTQWRQEPGGRRGARKAAAKQPH